MNYSKLGWRIREIRRQKRISQTQIARELNFSQQHIGNVENGYVHPSVDLLVRISNTLDVSVDYLLQDSLHRSYDDSVKSGVISDIQLFLDQQQTEIIELQKMIQDL